MQTHCSSMDHALRTRALAVIPGGLWGHMRTQYLGETYPQFFSRASGCRLWDVDGREYVDLMCSWGPIILGHRDPQVEEAAERQRKLGDVMNGPGDVLVELAELLVETVAHARWAMFQKSGTDATTTCVTIARAATGRKKILVARGSYHGAAPWCTPSMVGVTAEDRAHLIHFDYNDTNDLERAADEAGRDLAGIIVTAFRHDVGRDQELPTPDFARCARAICDDSGAALVLDDVRAGFRINLGGSWEHLGVRPDLCAWSKAIANGYPLAAVTGVDWLREAASKVFVTGSFWYGTVAMAAAVATIKALRERDALSHIKRMGQRLRDGLDALSRHHGVSIRQTGPAQMPLIMFNDDPDFKKAFCFCAAALEHGAYFHPKHNMFVSAAHAEADIDLALNAADRAFACVRQLSA